MSARVAAPLRPGKTRRNLVSNTRKRLDWIVEEAKPCNCLETNVFSTPSEELGELAAEGRATAVFDFLLREVRPAVLVFHGNDAKKHAERHLGIQLTLNEWNEVAVDGRSVQAVAVQHFARGWSEVRARELGRTIRTFCGARS